MIQIYIVLVFYLFFMIILDNNKDKQISELNNEIKRLENRIEFAEKSIYNKVEYYSFLKNVTRP